MEEEELRLAFEKKLGRGRADSTLRRRSTPGGSSGEQVRSVNPQVQLRHRQRVHARLQQLHQRQAQRHHQVLGQQQLHPIHDQQNVLQVMPSEQFAQARIPIEKMSHEMQQQLQQELHQQNQQQQVEPGPGSLPPEFSFDSRGLRRCPLKNLAQNSASIPTIPFFVPNNDEFVGREICESGNFQEFLIKAFLHYIRPGSTVIDAGSNIGSYAVHFAYKTGPAGKVYAFEPQPMVYQLMLANAVFCGSGNIEAHQAALGFKTGEASMGAKLPDGVSQGQSFEDAQKEGTKINYGGRSLGGGGEVVPMRTLDSYNISNLSFIKTDVQGSENLLIWGARETILR
eukprot:gene17986-24398_t